MDPITVQATIAAPIQKVWDYYTNPVHIGNWNTAQEDWHTTKSENDLRVGGRFVSRMEAKDGSQGFDFGGTYEEVILENLLKYTMDDGRKVTVEMAGENDQTTVTVTFDPEKINVPERQRIGWQAILDNFKKYVEAN